MIKNLINTRRFRINLAISWRRFGFGVDATLPDDGFKSDRIDFGIAAGWVLVRGYFYFKKGSVQ